MKQRKWLWFGICVLGAAALGSAAYTFIAGLTHADTSLVGKDAKPGSLPIRQVVLFNSGLGYFQREGDVDGNARVELSFPVGDINDLLKSLVLQDAKGRVGTVTYDSNDPIEKILRSFALDLTGNPTFGQILNQARGEKVEITRGDKKVAGTVIGMEIQRRPAGKDQLVDVEILNLNTATGIQAIPLEQIRAVRFQNPVLENEFQRALQVLARSHDTQKKSVTVGFNGVGKRPVKAAYVVERPIWKTTYRLRIDAKDKIALQGWALVENPSDDDWTDVRMVLVSGKPISFRMNLYDPIYVPRPFVEPELFASLRPPVYGGAIGGEKVEQLSQARKELETIIKNIDQNVQAQTQRGKSDSSNAGGSSTGVVDKAAFEKLIADWGRLPPVEKRRALNDVTAGMSPRHREAVEDYFNRIEHAKDKGKLSYDELIVRRMNKAAEKNQADAITNMDNAKKKTKEAGYDQRLAEAKIAGKAIAGFNFREGIQSVASADEVGEYFQYVIDQKISLARQKSAMLPILDLAIEGKKFSIFNEAVHAKYPLLGLKLKNTTGQPLTQGPITVYDGVFGGDTRILDVQPGEERLLSYALDQGTEVKIDVKQTPSPDMNLKVGSDHLAASYQIRQTKTYTIKNRSKHDRQVLVEHPLRSEWKLVEPKKPLEQTRDVYRFLVAVPAGKTMVLDVVEDTPHEAMYGVQSEYPVADGINIKVVGSAEFHKLVGVKIVKGVVLPTYRTREAKAYTVQNLSDIDRAFTVDHIVRPDWTRLDDKNDPHAGPEVFRFKIAVAKGKTGQQTVREERVVTEKGTLLKTLPETVVRDYLVNTAVSNDVKAALTKTLAQQAKIADTQKEIADIEKQLSVLNADNTRVRENLKIIPMNSDYYKTFLEKFVAQDKQIESLQKRSRELNATLQGQLRDFEQTLATLNAE